VRQQLLEGFPFIGSQALCRKSILRQLRLRTEGCLIGWRTYSERERASANHLSKIIQETFLWPNSYFIPEDPAEILLWEQYGDMSLTEAIMKIESCLGLSQKSNSEWKALLKLQFGDFVRKLSGTAR
jgi:hypothetical protein